MTRFVLDGKRKQQAQEGPWQSGAPAVGAVLAQLAQLYARAVRVELARRERGAARVAAAARRLPP